MNLSKIAIGIAASICLMSNVTWAAPAAPAATTPAAPESSKLDSKESIYSKTLEQKAREKFDTLYKELNIDELLKQSNEKDPRALLEFSGEDVPKFFDFIGYGEAINRLKGMPNNPNRFKTYYPLKMLNDEINESKQKIDDNLENTKKMLDKKSDIEEVKKNSQEIAKNKKLITDNRKLIDVNKSELDIHSNSIVENNNRILINTKAIETMNKQLSTRLDNLNKSLKSGLATQSALNGLFQPYNIGKMNVSAALGGYKSHNALAVGAGFRFNKNVAAKAGISSSFDGSALSYNMGVNYEF